MSGRMFLAWCFVVLGTVYGTSTLFESGTPMRLDAIASLACFNLAATLQRRVTCSQSEGDDK